MHSVERRALSGSLVGIIALLLNLVQAILLVPFLLTYWNPMTYGLWMAIAAAGALIITLDSGHQNYLGNEFTRLWIEDQCKLIVTVKSAVLAAVVVGSIELTVGILVSTNKTISHWFGFNNGGSAACIALITYLAFWALNGSIGGLLVRLYMPSGLFTWSQWLGIMSRVAGVVALVFAVAIKSSIAGAMIAQAIAWSLCNLYVFYDLRQRFPSIYPLWRGGDWLVAFQNFRSSLVLTINGFVEQGTNSGLILMISRTLDPVSVALFTTLRTVANFALQGTSVILNPILPDLVRYHIKKDGRKISGVLLTSWFLCTTLVTMGLLGAILVLAPLYNLWTRHALPLNALLFAFLGGAVAFRTWAAPMQSYLISINKLKAQSTMTALRAICTLSIGFLTVRSLGLAAAGLGLLLGEIAAGIISLLIVYDELKEIRSYLPVNKIIIPLLQIVIMEFNWIMRAVLNETCISVLCVSALIVLLLAWKQWQDLPLHIRERLLSSGKRCVKFITP